MKKYTTDEHFKCTAWWRNLGYIKRRDLAQKYDKHLDFVLTDEMCEMYTLEMFERIKVKVDLGLKFQYKFSEN